MPNMVSVIIPCFNDGQFLEDAIFSVTSHEGFGTEIEIVIVNDGSTNEETLAILKTLSTHNNPGIVILNQENKGLAAARNAGIKQSNGTVIIPLDADNKLTSDYLDLGIELAKEGSALNERTDIVYGDPIFFGADNSIHKWSNVGFRPSDILHGNFIDACACIKKDIWSRIGGYDENMVHGYEDWEFWINAFGHGARFDHVNKKLFYYRVRNDSMVTSSKKPDTHHAIKKYIYTKHMDLVMCELNRLRSLERSVDDVIKHPYKIFQKIFTRLKRTRS